MDNHIQSNWFVFSLFLAGCAVVGLVVWIIWGVM